MTTALNCSRDRVRRRRFCIEPGLCRSHRNLLTPRFCCDSMRKPGQHTHASPKELIPDGAKILPQDERRLCIPRSSWPHLRGSTSTFCSFLYSTTPSGIPLELQHVGSYDSLKVTLAKPQEVRHRSREYSKFGANIFLHPWKFESSSTLKRTKITPSIASTILGYSYLFAGYSRQGTRCEDPRAAPCPATQRRIATGSWVCATSPRHPLEGGRTKTCITACAQHRFEAQKCLICYCACGPQNA